MTDKKHLNQRSINKKSIFKENSLKLIETIKTNVLRDMSYLTEENQLRQYNSYILLLDQIRQSLLIDPRYPHLILQEKIDDLYRRTNGELKEYIITFSVNELIHKENFNPVVYGK